MLRPFIDHGLNEIYCKLYNIIYDSDMKIIFYFILLRPEIGNIQTSLKFILYKNGGNK